MSSPFVLTVDAQAIELALKEYLTHPDEGAGELVRICQLHHVLPLWTDWVGCIALQPTGRLVFIVWDDPEKVEPWFLRDSPGFAIVPELTPRPSEAVFDKLAMSAFEGTPLAFALRDCGITALAIVGIAMEIGIEPTSRHAADLGIIPVVIEDACGAGHAEAAQRSCEALRFAGDAIMTDTEAFCAALGKAG